MRINIFLFLIAIAAKGQELSIHFPFDVKLPSTWMVRVENNGAQDLLLSLDKSRENELYTMDDRLNAFSHGCVVYLEEGPILGSGQYWKVVFDDKKRVKLFLPQHKCLLRITLPQILKSHPNYEAFKDYSQELFRIDAGLPDPYFFAYAPLDYDVILCEMPLLFAIEGTYLHRIVDLSSSKVLFQTMIQIKREDLESNRSTKLGSEIEFVGCIKIDAEAYLPPSPPLVRIEKTNKYGETGSGDMNTKENLGVEHACP
jgi:hypothetical protein